MSLQRETSLSKAWFLPRSASAILEHDMGASLVLAELKHGLRFVTAAEFVQVKREDTNEPRPRWSHGLVMLAAFYITASPKPALHSRANERSTGLADRPRLAVVISKITTLVLVIRAYQSAWPVSFRPLVELVVDLKQSSRSIEYLIENLLFEINWSKDIIDPLASPLTVRPGPLSQFIFRSPRFNHFNKH